MPQLSTVSFKVTENVLCRWWAESCDPDRPGGLPAAAADL